MCRVLLMVGLILPLTGCSKTIHEASAKPIMLRDGGSIDVPERQSHACAEVVAQNPEDRLQSN